MDQGVKNFVLSEFSISEYCFLFGFLEKDFSREGREAIVAIFLIAHEYHKTADEVLALLQKEWERNWSHQDPIIRANPDVPGEIGTQNLCSFRNICRSLMPTSTMVN